MLDKEPGVTRADLFHTRFDAQYGIDAFADHASDLIVQSDKRYAKVLKGQLAQWSDEFLKHWENVWRDKKVTKFILAVAAPMHSRERLADIKVEKARFAALGVAYEVWSPTQLQEKLRRHPGIVRQYLGSQEWVERICDTVVVDDGASQAALADLQERITNLGGALGEQIKLQLDSLARDIDRGQAGGLEDTLTTLRAGPGFAQLGADQQARLIRLQGSAALNREDLEAAKDFSAEADAIAQPDEPRLRAVIAWRADGVETALSTLGDPKTDHGRALGAAMLLTQGRLDQAKALIAKLPEAQPERLRLSGHILLLEDDPDAALPLLEAAVAAAPDAPVGVRLLAMGRYAAALSPKTGHDLYLHPQPLNEALVRQDETAAERLCAARDAFESLVAASPSTAARELDAAWALACRCLLKDADADAAARDLLQAWPTNVYGIGWVLARNLDVDLSVSRAVLLSALETGQLDPNGPRVLDWLTPAPQRATLLTAVEVALAQPIWPRDVAAELVALKGRLTGDEEHPSLVERASRAIELAIHSQDWDSVESVFRDQIAENPEAPLVLGLADALANAARWPILAEYAEILEAFETADSVTLAALARFNTRDVKGALGLIEANLGLFSGRHLPFVLRRVEAEGLAALGDPVAAVERAAALAVETESADDRLRQAKLLHDLGDARAAAPLVRDLLEREQLEPEDALQWSQRLVSEDLELARSLWRHAVDQPIDDHLAASAYVLAFELNLEAARPDLILAMRRLAQSGDGSVRMVDMDEIVAQVRDNQDRMAELEAAWTGGRAPQHFLSQALKISLADLLNLQLAPDNRLRPVFIRHGSRGVPPPDPSPISAWRLYMDVSALLVADQLDLLPVLEELETPIFIGAATSRALREIADAARDHQPSRGRDADRVLSAMGQGIGVVAPVDAWRVSHEPDQAAHPQVIGLADLLDALAALGRLDAAAHPLLASRTASDATRSDTPSEGQALVFCDQTLDLIADTPAFAAVLEVFDVYVDAGSLQLSREEAARGRRAAAITERVARLRQTVARKLRAKSWVTVVVEADARPGSGAVGRALGQVMRAAEADPDARVWFEDRLMTSYLGVGQATIVESLEVLAALRTARMLDEAGYFDRLLRLRGGGALFIPFSVEEVLFHLNAAPIREGEVVETAALEILRRNFSLSLIFETSLKLLPEADNDRPVELEVVISNRQLAKETIQACWGKGTSTAIAQARSTWIYRALRSEQPHIPSQEASAVHPATMFTALNISSLTAIAFALHQDPGEAPRARRQAYFEWLENEVLQRRLALDPALRDTVADHVRQYLRLDRSENIAPELRATLRGYLAELASHLPQTLLEAVGGDKAFMESLGFGETTIITLGEHRVLASAFWDAVAEAVNGRPGVFVTQEGLTGTAGWSDESPEYATFEGLNLRVSETALCLLSEDATRRDAAIDAFVADAEIAPQDQPQVRTELSTLPPSARMEKVANLREANFKNFLGALAQSLENQEPISMDRFDPPSARSLLRYVRWDDSGGAEAASEALRADLNTNQAIARAVSLPFALPAELWGDADLTRQRMITPLSRIHRLHAIRTGALKGHHDLTNEVEALVHASATYGNLFTTLLRRSAIAFEAQQGWAELSPVEKHVCIWTFAERMTDLLGAVGAEPHASINALNDALPAASSSQAMMLEEGYDDSALSAGTMTPAWLLRAGLEYALGNAFEGLQLTEIQNAALKAQLNGVGLDGQPVPHPVRTLTDTGPAFETWLNRPAPIAALDNSHFADSLVEQALVGLEVDPNEPICWAVIYGFGQPAITPAQRLRLAGVFAKLDLPVTLARTDDPGSGVRKIADVAARLAPHEASEAMLNALASVSEVFLPQNTDGSFGIRLHDLIEAGAAAARSRSSDGADRFFRFIRALLSKRPDIAETLRPILDRLVDLTPTGQSGDFWRALVQSRAY